MHCIVYLCYLYHLLLVESFQPRLSTEDEFNRLTVALPTETIFIGRLSTQASDVKV